MGICCSKSDIEPSVPTPAEKTQSAQPISIPDGTTSTPSARPGTTMSALVRAQSQGSTLSRGRHDDGRDCPPRLSRGDVLTSQHPDRQEMRSRQYPSDGTGPMQRTKFMSIDVTALQSALSHSYRRMNKTAPPAVHGSGHQCVGTQSVSSLSSATSRITAGRRGGRPRFPFALQSLLPNDFRYAVRL